MVTVLDSLNAALHRAFAADTRVILLGEDVLDPYGGAFRITQGLSTVFPGRVLTTPISEAGIVGVATGMALRGLRPVVEIMFGDFLTLIADQVINHAAKFGWMYGGNKSPQEQVHVPMVIRTPMGGRRGYGPTHSQTLEKFFLGVPGLRILAPTHLGDPGGLLEEIVLKTDDPVLFVENKLLYLAQVLDGEGMGDFDLQVIKEQGIGDKEPNSLSSHFPPLTYTLTLRQAPSPTLTLAAYGYMAELARQAMLKLAYEHEVFTELVIPTQLAPVSVDSILDSAGRTGRLLVVEEGTFTHGWGAEILARAAEVLGSRLRVASRLAARDLPVPSSGALENGVLPGIEDIVQRTVMLQNR